MGAFETVWRNIKEWWNIISRKWNKNEAKKTIKLAVIGETSSGKTYFLIDMVRSLQKLRIHMKPNINSESDFLPRLESNAVRNNPDGYIDGTPIYPCRHSEICCSGLTESANAKYSDCTELQALDIPGEIFKADHLQVFYGIMRTLANNHVDKVFRVETYSKSSGRVSVKVVRYVKNGRDGNVNAPVQEDKKESSTGKALVGVGTQQETENKEIAHNRYSQYHRYEEETAWLIDQGFKLENKVKWIDGIEFFKNFLAFNVDTSMYAIYDAWGDKDLNFERNMPKVKTKNAGKEEEKRVDRNLFEAEYMNSIFFFRYIMDATDVVLCNRVGVIGEQIGENQYWNILQNLYSFNEYMYEVDKNNKKNWYLAFRGIDLALNDSASCLNELYNILKNEVKGVALYNAMYSMFVLMLQKKNDSQRVLLKKDDKQEEQSEKNDDEALDINDILNIAGLSQNCSEKVTKKIESMLDEKTISTLFMGHENLRLCIDGNHLFNGENALDNYISESVNSFTELAQNEFYNQDGIYSSLAPHVYFTSSAIDNYYHIYKNEKAKGKEGLMLIGGDAGNSSRRAYFGTMQLVVDMLEKNKFLKGGARGQLLDNFSQS